MREGYEEEEMEWRAHLSRWTTPGETLVIGDGRGGRWWTHTTELDRQRQPPQAQGDGNAMDLGARMTSLA